MMKKQIAIGIAAFTLLMGNAVAQQESQSSSTTTKTYDDGSVNVEKKSHSVDANGVETERHHSYTAAPNGAESKSVTETNTPDGKSIRTKQKRVTTPDGRSKTDTTTSTEKW